MKKILSFIMAAMMVVMMLPAVVSAAEITTVEALNSAIVEATDGAVIDLGGNTINASERVVVAGKKITITNGTIKSTADQAIRVYGGAELTLKNVTVDGATWGIVIRETNTTAAGTAVTKLNIVDSKVINASNMAISGNGYSKNVGTEITITNSEIKGDSVGIYHPQKGTLTVNSSKVVGKTAIEMRGGTLVVNGNSVIEATGTYTEPSANGSGSTTVGVAIAVSQHSTELPIKVVINNGVLNGDKSFVEVDTVNDESSVSIAIKNGTFKGGVSSENCTEFVYGGSFADGIDEDYIVDTSDFTVNSDGSVSVACDHVSDETYVRVNGNYHGTWCTKCGNYFVEEHTYTEWERDGYKNVRECEYCGATEVKALTADQKALDNIKAYMKSMSVRRFAVAIDADETVVITNNTAKTRIFKDYGDSAAYEFLADVKYDFAAAEGYEIVAVYVDGVEVDAENVVIRQIKGNHVIKVVTEAVEAEEAAE